MSAFQPCIGTRAQIDARPVVDGQFLIACDTGEAFIDHNGVRIKIAGGGSSSGGETSSGDEDEDSFFLTSFSVVNPAVAMSESVSGGGPGNGVLNAPEVLFDHFDDDLMTSYSIMEGI